MNNRGRGEERLRLAELLRREYAVRKDTADQEDALQEAAAALHQPEADALYRTRLKTAIETLSNGTNTVIYDDFGQPSIMTYIPPLQEKDLLPSSTSAALHPAFLPGGRGCLIGKYQCSLYGGQACSLPMGEPISGVDFDTACALCRRKGDGWSITPFALRMAIALSCRKRGFLPHGNNNKGCDFTHPAEQGTLAGDGPVLCGSGPAAWAHDNTVNGVYDLNGNLNEWDAGLRIMDGEIQVIPVDQLLAPGADLGPRSPLWRAIDETGALAMPGTPGTLHYDAPDGGIRLTRTMRSLGIGNCAFADVQTEAGLTPPPIATLLGLCPQPDRSGYGLGWRWISTTGEVLPLCGGAFRAEDHAGVFFVGATYPRTKDYALTGLRAVYYPKEEKP
ncbi:MAG TPA: hypothetical protein PK537_00615 [Candidatus Limiplasma sp.]|nr:hypothetical protein [Candidatus Limiplasma sp.]